MEYRPKKTAAVLGGASGLGFATVKLLAQNGYRVYVFDFVEPKEELEEVFFVECDFRDEYKLELAVRLWYANVGRLDLLVNNLGERLAGAADLTSAENATSILNLNVIAVEKCNRMMIPFLRYTKGRLINVCGYEALEPIPFQALYSAGEAFLLTYTKTVALELKQVGVFATAVIVGGMKNESLAIEKGKEKGKEIYGHAIEKSKIKFNELAGKGKTEEEVAAEIMKLVLEEQPPITKLVGFKHCFNEFTKRFLTDNAVSTRIDAKYCSYKEKRPSGRRKYRRETY